MNTSEEHRDHIKHAQTAGAPFLPDGPKLLQGLHQVSLQDTVHQAPDVHHRGGERFVRVIVALLQTSTHNMTLVGSWNMSTAGGKAMAQQTGRDD